MIKRSKLVFDSASAEKDFTAMILQTCDEIIQKFFNEATDGLEELSDTDIISAKIESKKKISAKVIFSASAILESYGTGSLMDKNNPYLQEYMNSPLWNPERHSETIVGRAVGWYTDIFGEERFSKGNFEGLYIEHIATPIHPKYTIQQAEDWLLGKNSYIDRYLDYNIKEFVKGMRKYFKTVSG